MPALPTRPTERGERPAGGSPHSPASTPAGPALPRSLQVSVSRPPPPCRSASSPRGPAHTRPQARTRPGPSSCVPARPLARASAPPPSSGPHHPSARRRPLGTPKGSGQRKAQARHRVSHGCRASPGLGRKGWSLPDRSRRSGEGAKSADLTGPGNDPQLELVSCEASNSAPARRTEVCREHARRAEACGAHGLRSGRNVAPSCLGSSPRPTVPTPQRFGRLLRIRSPCGV